MKRPAFQFYPGDWQRDPALRSCSVGARGLWIEMICVMHQSEPYGHLVINGQGIPPETLSRLVGASAKEVLRWLSELEGAGVFSREGETIVSRRMVRDETERAKWRERQSRHRDVTPTVTGSVTPQSQRSSVLQSSVLQSSSSKESKALSGKPDVSALKLEKLNGYRAQAREILIFLNEKTGKAFEPVDANLELIIARLRESTPDDIRAVVAMKCREWQGDEKASHWLRPATLFGRTKFAQYKGELK